MKKLILSVLTASVMVAMAKSGEYRNFTSQDGRTIVAKIIGYDVDAHKVQLELENRKKAWVEITALSNDDQEFIKQSQQKEPEKEVEPQEVEKPLSRKEIRDIATNYTKSINNRDYQLWRELYVDLGDKRISVFDGASADNFSRLIGPSVSVSVGKVEGLNVLVYDYESSGYTFNGWLQLLPNGKIKYDPVAYRHPIVEASWSLHSLLPESRYSAGCLREFKRLDIPTFGYDLEASDEDRENAVMQIANWIIDNGGDWDNSEPKVSLPEDVFKGLVRMIRQHIL